MTKMPAFIREIYLLLFMLLLGEYIYLNKRTMIVNEVTSVYWVLFR